MHDLQVAHVVCTPAFHRYILEVRSSWPIRAGVSRLTAMAYTSADCGHLRLAQSQTHLKLRGTNSNRGVLEPTRDPTLVLQQVSRQVIR